MTLFFNLILFVLDWLALWRLRRTKSVIAWLFSLLVIIIIAALLAAVFARDHFDFIRLATYGFFLHGFTLSLGSAILWWRINKSLAIFSGLASLILAGTAYDAFLIEPFRLEVSHWQITSPKLHRTLRIVVIADLQTDRFEDYQRSVLRRAMEEKPDLILLAGDYLQTSYDRFQLLKRQMNSFLREINFSAPLGIFAVRGNIDLPYWREVFDGLNIITVDHCQSFDLGELQLTCLGLLDSYSTNMKVTNPRNDDFHLVLGHVPNYALGDIEADLLLAGHTHGGQVCIPLIGALITHSRIPLAWSAGLTKLPNGSQLLVSRGIGMERDNAPRMRFLCRPELMVIDLAPIR